MTEYLTGRRGATEDLCRFLAACFYEPSNDFAEERLFDSIRTSAEAIDPSLGELARVMGEAFAAQDLESLLIDYTRLFIGPSQPAAMPYASFWIAADPSERHEATVAVVNLYAKGGFDVSEEIHELPDHIAVELEFLYALVFALNHPNSGNRGKIEAVYKRFLGDHMLAWISRFAAAMRAGAETNFYRYLADLTERFVLMEARQLPG